MANETPATTLEAAQQMVQRFHGKYAFAIGLLKRLQASKRDIEPASLTTQLDYQQKRQEWDNVGVQRVALISEELSELARAWLSMDTVELADALADLIYVVLGTAVAAGIDMTPIFEEVHNSNMTKEQDKQFKPAKGENFKPPQLYDILKKAGFDAQYHAK